MTVLRRAKIDLMKSVAGLAAFFIGGSTAVDLLGWNGFESVCFGSVFNLPHLVSPGEFAIGLEPDLMFSNPVNLGVNLKFTQGITDNNNFSATLGSGGASRGFRVGGAFTFDFFPDLQNQPGVGLALGALYVQLPSAGSMEITATPYVHKGFVSGSVTVDPFLAFPFGLSLSQGMYQIISTVAMGALFQHSAHFATVVEFGIGISNSSSYLSGGVVYYH